MFAAHFNKIFKHLFAELGIVDFGMKLEAEAVSGGVFHSLNLAGRAAGGDGKPFRDDMHLVVVRFPNRLRLVRSCKNRSSPVHEFDLHRTEFRLGRFSGIASIMTRHELVTSTDAQDWDGEFKVGGAVPEFTREANTRRATGKDQSVEFPKFIHRRGVVNDLRVHAEVAEHSPFPVCPLASVIDHIDDQGCFRHLTHRRVTEERP